MPLTTPNTERFFGRQYSRSRLRDQWGPDRPIFALLELLTNEGLNWRDDFTTSLDTTLWTATNSGGIGVANFARTADQVNGVIRGNPGTDNNADVRLFTTSNENVFTQSRPILIGRLSPITAITSSKFEFGFADAVAAGQVNVKATPTSTGANYAVAIRDTTENTSIDLISDGTTPAIAKTVGAHGVTWTLDGYHTIMLALVNTTTDSEAFFWIKGAFGGRVATGPDISVSLAPFIYMQNRAASSHPLDVDYVRLIADRQGADA